MQVLDKGFVELVDFMGSDLSIVRAARVSYNKDISTDPEKDKKLIFFLMRNKHETPLEHTALTFHVKAPLFVARQWFRHRIGSFTEVSGRYVELKEEFYIPEQLRTQVGKNYQYETLQESVTQIEKIEEHYKETYRLYKELLESGVAKEQARCILPPGLYTSYYWTVNVRSLMNFLRLRLDQHAQEEIRKYAEAIMVIFKEKFPITANAFEESLK